MTSALFNHLQTSKPRAGSERRLRPRIGLLLNTLSYTYQKEILQGAHEEAALRGADLICFSGGAIGTAEIDARSSLYELVTAESLDALVLSTSTLGNEAGGQRVLEFARRFPGIPICSIGGVLDGMPSILVDNFSGVRDVTLHLIDVHQRTRIAFVSGPTVNEESERRLAGYRAALQLRHLPQPESFVIIGDFTDRAGVAAVEQLFAEGHGGCDAIVTANDWMALGVLEALDQRGLRVPRDVAVIGFDDIDEARFTTPALSTIRQPIRELGAQATRQVLATIAGQPPPVETVLPTRIVLRQSCGCFDGSASAWALRPERSEIGLGGLTRDRAELTDQLGQTMPETDGPESNRDRADRVLTSLCRDLVEGTDQQFLAVFRGLLDSTSAWGNIHAWHGPLSFLRAHVGDYLGRHTTEGALMERIVERAHVETSAAAEHGQGRRRLEQENLLRQLQQTAATLLTSVDFPSFGRALAKSLPTLAVPGCGVVLQPGGRLVADAPARLIVAYDVEGGLLLDNPYEARAQDVLVPPQLPNARRSVVLEPLFVGTDVLGFCALEIGPLNGTVYEVLREHISATVKGVQLFAAVVEEVRRREQAERARLEDEMRVATRIQTGILPKTTAASDLQIAATMIPATEVGGDYFDIQPFDGGCWLGIGDVAGHGLPTGVVMLMIQSVVAATTYSRSDASAGAVWHAVNSVLYDNLKRLQQEEYATLSLIRYEKSGKLTMAGAHEELIIYRHATRACETLPLVGTWVGIMPPSNEPVPEEAAHLAPGDVLVLYTDGATEAMNASKEQYGVERLCNAVASVGERTVEEIRDHLIRCVNEWSADQFDDVTVVVIRRKEAGD